ncbi:hypothetical protein [Duganella sp. P38]|uniref:hypothetical protein n=1 Tax=Duganella sp. P38 TaxID=3423949 RepID=UPI003D7AC5E5
MRIALPCLAAVVACLSAAPVYAQQQAPVMSATDQEPVESVSVTARRTKLLPQDFQPYEYEYVLSNGDMVRFSHQVRRYFLSLRGRPGVEIFPVADGEFVTKDGAKLTFTEDGEVLNIDRYETVQRASGVSIAIAPQAQK